MGEAEDFPGKIGRIALAQAQVDEWLVQILIALLKPLPESRVQLLVGKSSLDQKGSLIRQLAGDTGLSLDAPLASGVVPNETLREINKLNNARDRAVHSYYDRIDGDRTRQFRSRKPGAEPVTIGELTTIADELVRCIADLRDLTEELEMSSENQLGAGSRWADVVRGTHEVIVAGHLHERRMLDDVSREFDSKGIVRLALRGASRRILGENESPSAGEYLAEISAGTWLASISSPDGEKLQFGDTGWRDVTALAREEDPDVERAVIRRVGDSVLCSFEGGKMASAPLPQPRDRLAERAFGPVADPGLKIPGWVLGLEGFDPAPDSGA